MNDEKRRAMSMITSLGRLFDAISSLGEISDRLFILSMRSTYGNTSYKSMYSGYISDLQNEYGNDVVTEYQDELIILRTILVLSNFERWYEDNFKDECQYVEKQCLCAWFTGLIAEIKERKIRKVRNQVVSHLTQRKGCEPVSKEVREAILSQVCLKRIDSSSDYANRLQDFREWVWVDRGLETYDSVIGRMTLMIKDIDRTYGLNVVSTNSFLKTRAMYSLKEGR